MKLDQVRRLGSAFVSAQALLNTLSSNISELELLIKDLSIRDDKKPYLDKFTQILEILNSDYEVTKTFLSSCEPLIKEFERGNNLSIKPTIIEAKIAVFNQRREVALNEIEYIKNYIGKYIS